MDLPKIPEKHGKLVELEGRRRTIRAQRRELEIALQDVETELGKLITRDEAEREAVAEQLADGTLTEIASTNLPERRDMLRARLDLVVRGDQKLAQRLARERERHAKRVVTAFQPAHKAAVQRIHRALEELVAANAAERELRDAAPVQLVAMAFPNVGTFGASGAPARYWHDYAKRLGFFEPEPEVPAEPKASSVPRRVRSKANGAAEPKPAMVAKGSN